MARVWLEYGNSESETMDDAYATPMLRLCYANVFFANFSANFSLFLLPCYDLASPYERPWNDLAMSR